MYCVGNVNKQLIRRELFCIMEGTKRERLSMTAKKRKLLCVLVVFLFLVVLTLIGWLAHVLFTFRIGPPASESVPVAPVQRYAPGPGPLSETVIYAEAPPGIAGEAAVPGDGDESPAETEVAVGAAVLIPSICEGYGPQIRSRETFLNPVTHQTVITATRAVVTLTLQPEVP